MFVAIISSFHVLASHITVAAGWFNLYLERRAVCENRPEFYEYLKRSALGLLVFAYVFGALAGVGIWQSVTASNPRGISTLIHNFVLYWGAEWYMFLIDVVGITAYYYTLGRVSPRTHLRLAWILALGGTGTLSIIVGILSFKLTPGLWLTTGESLNGFFNPTFWPQITMRLGLMFAITAAWALLIAAGMPKTQPARNQIIRLASAFGLSGLVVALGIWSFWYYPSLSEHAKTILLSPAIPPITYTVIIGGLVATFLVLLYALALPRLQHPVVALGALAVLFGAIFGAERTREVMRKPDIIAGYMASNQIVVADIPARGVRSEEKLLQETGMSGHLPFLPKLSQPEELGRALVVQQCASCHTVSNQTSINSPNGPLSLRSVARLLEKRSMTSAPAIETYLQVLGGFPYMHPVIGTAEERSAMAAYLEGYVQEQQAQRKGSLTRAQK